MNKLSEFVFPGKEIATSEEAVSGSGTVEENGLILAALGGKGELRGGKAFVSNPKSVRMLARGDLIYGKVYDLFDQVALIMFKPAGENVGTSADMAFLRIAEIQRGYTESFSDFLRIGDLVKAKVIDVTPMGVYVTIAESGLGVVKAYCTSCRRELDNQLHCAVCDRRERRKMA
jgi:exosome complex component CSL4